MSAKTVLVVDDDQVLVTMIKDGLETRGYRVVTAYDALQGILQAHQSRPDVILLDFQMPSGGGSGAYERLRESQDTRDTPIVFMTGVTAQQVREKVKSSPRTYFLKKPVSLEQLLSVLAHILQTGGAPFPKAPSAPLGAAAPAAPTAPSAKDPLDAFRPKTGSARMPPPTLRSAGGGWQEQSFTAGDEDCDPAGTLSAGALHLRFHEGRKALLAKAGVLLDTLEGVRGLRLPLCRAELQFRRAPRRGDTLVVRTRAVALGPASAAFEQELRGGPLRDALLARGFFRLVLTAAGGKPMRWPKDLELQLRPFVA